MLVLSRKAKQKIMIGGDIEITVLAIKGDSVRLGIVAPRSVPVYREEIYLKWEKNRADDQSAKQERLKDSGSDGSAG